LGVPLPEEFVRHTLAFSALVLTAAAAGGQADMKPTNDAPNPYNAIADYFKMPDGRIWGSTSGVGIHTDGKSIWVAERCAANSCATSILDPLILFDASGKIVRMFGGGIVYRPHGLTVDHEGNLWVTDWGPGAGRGGAAAAAPANPRGHQVFKFSPDGKLLMTLGKAGGGRDTAFFFEPNQVAVAKNGDIFVAEGHSSQATSTGRILKFDKTGKLLASWGKWGKGPEDYDQPHALAFDSQGRLFVGDRGNNRVKILDPNTGKLLDTWYQFSRPSGIFIDKNDVIYVADSESGTVAPTRPDWQRGIRIGSAKDGKITAFIPDQAPVSGTSSAEGIAVDAAGNIYGAEVGQKQLRKYVKK
jgi:DNA-binding beta-propeller fold protein YncE